MANVGFELSDSQHNILKMLATGNIGFFFAALHPIEGKDNPEQFEKLYNGLKECSELVELGLLEDVSEKFKDEIEKNFLENGRRFSILHLTTQGYQMFAEQESKVSIN